MEFCTESHTKSIQCDKIPVLLGEGELLIQLKINRMICPHLGKQEEVKRLKITTTSLRNLSFYVFGHVQLCVRLQAGKSPGLF